MTAAETSRLSGVSESLISNYLRGAFNPKVDKIDLLARALNVNPVWLMGRDIPDGWDHYDVQPETDTVPTMIEQSAHIPTDPVLAELISMYEQMTTLERSKLLIAAAEMLGDR